MLKYIYVYICKFMYIYLHLLPSYKGKENCPEAGYCAKTYALGAFLNGKFVMKIIFGGSCGFLTET